MPDAVWHFCRYPLCGHRAQFVAKKEEKIRCPKCDRDMQRQDTSWSRVPAVEWKTGKEEA